MAAPNIANLTTIVGVTTSLALTTSSQTVVSNAASSSKVFKINSISASNVSGATAKVTIRYAQGAAGAGTTVSLANGIDVTSGSTLIVLDKSSTIYLEEERSITALASANSAIDLVVSYEDITNV